MPKLVERREDCGFLVGSHVTLRNPIPSYSVETRRSMKRAFAIVLAVVAAGGVFAGLVHVVLVAAHVSEPAANTVYGLTPRRLWATATALIALVSVGVGGLALSRALNRSGAASGRRPAILAMLVGLVAAVSGGLNVAVATGGPGTGNGVVGGAAAFVMGLIGMAIGGLALTRSDRTASGPGE